MKPLVIFFIAVACATNSFAQLKMEPPVKELIMMKDGKMWLVKRMDSTMTMKNGIKLLTDGTVQMQDGRTITLNDNDCMNLDGHMVGMNEKATANVLMKSGRMWKVMKIENNTILDNGTTVRDDGTVSTKNGNMVVLRNGEWADIAENNTLTTYKISASIEN